MSFYSIQVRDTSDKGRGISGVSMHKEGFVRGMIEWERMVMADRVFIS